MTARPEEFRRRWRSSASRDYQFVLARPSVRMVEVRLQKGDRAGTNLMFFPGEQLRAVVHVPCP